MTVRVDAWLWGVRVAKTRSQATALCKAGHVQVNGERAKPAEPVKPGDVVRVRDDAGERTLEVVELLSKRVGAPIAQAAYRDLTPPPPPKAERVSPVAMRERGSGRPTKRQRRDIEKLRGY